MRVNMTAAANRTKNGEDLFIDQDDWPQILAITCILALFSVVGATGNAFVLYVFSRKKDKNTSTIFILALAIIDFLTCVVIIPFTIYVEFNHKKIYNDVACKIYQFLITSNVPFSAFIMVAIAFDRYFCICRPWMKCLDVKRAKRIIFSLFVFAVGLGLMTCLAYGVYQQKSAGNDTISTASLDTHSANHTFSQINGTANDNLGYSSNKTSQTFTNNPQLDIFPKEVSIMRKTHDLVFEFTGFCYPNEVIVSSDVRKVYHKLYASLFLLSFITVFLLYGLIYKSLLTRRSKRLRTSAAYRHQMSRRSTLLSSVFTRHSYCPSDKPSATPPGLNNQPGDTLPHTDKQPNTNLTITDNLIVPSANDDERTVTSVVGNGADENSTLETTPGGETPTDLSQNHCSRGNHETKHNHKSYTRKNKITNARFKDTNNECYRNNPNSDDKGAQQPVTINIYRKDTRKSVREKHMLANIKTAGILFIVTIVFMLAFLPSWLIATKLVPTNMIVFYMYFSYNVANPVIYAFFNHTFQKEVRHVLKCGQ